jgi:hypothetical protein
MEEQNSRCLDMVEKEVSERLAGLLVLPHHLTIPLPEKLVTLGTWSSGA